MRDELGSICALNTFALWPVLMIVLQMNGYCSSGLFGSMRQIRTLGKGFTSGYQRTQFSETHFESSPLLIRTSPPLPHERAFTHLHTFRWVSQDSHRKGAHTQYALAYHRLQEPSLYPTHRSNRMRRESFLSTSSIAGKKEVATPYRINFESRERACRIGVRIFGRLLPKITRQDSYKRSARVLIMVHKRALEHLTP